MENINIQNFSISDTPKILHTLPSLVKAKIIRRPSLTIKSPYVATIILIDDKSETQYLAHCPSLGCSGLCETGCTVFVSKNNNTSAKCDYVIQQAYYEEVSKNKCVTVGTAPKLAEKIVNQALLQNCFEDLIVTELQSEKCFKNSRFDFCGTLENDVPFILEVKTVPIAKFEDLSDKQYLKNNYDNPIDYPFESKTALFPIGYRKSKKEPISPRAIKHLNELAELKEENPETRCILCYVVQRIDVQCFQPSYQDEFYLEAYKNAVEKGVEIKILVVNWIGENAYFYRNDLPINI